MAATRISGQLLTDLSDPVDVWKPFWPLKIPHPNISGMRDDIALVKEILKTLEVPPSENETVQCIQKIIHDITTVNEIITEKIKGFALSIGVPALIKTRNVEKTIETLLKHVDDDADLKQRKKVLLDSFSSIDLNRLKITGPASRTAVAGLIDVFTITLTGFVCLEPYGLKPESNLPLLITGLSDMLENYKKPLPSVAGTPVASLKQVPRGLFDDEEEDFSDDEEEEDFSDDEETDPRFLRSARSFPPLKVKDKGLNKDGKLKAFQLIFEGIEKNALALSLEAKKIGLDHCHPIRLCIQDITTANANFKSRIKDETVTSNDVDLLKMHCRLALTNQNLLNQIKPPLAAKLRQALWVFACYLALPFQKMVKLARTHGRTSTVYDKGLPTFFFITPLEMTLEKASTEIRSLVLSPSNGMGSE